MIIIIFVTIVIIIIMIIQFLGFPEVVGGQEWSLLVVCSVLGSSESSVEPGRRLKKKIIRKHHGCTSWIPIRTSVTIGVQRNHAGTYAG